ncbi:hypothetical protein [Halorarius halobius]|uniref:hypothetical protein n=1 Tax=Halorarius halobius TaxID=2962671 RepID=UPI0020CE57B2|nr:hypothetical protein [Halorarius halobius]
MRRATLLAGLLVVSTLSVAGVGAQSAQVAVQGVEVTPEPAVVGETITIAPTIVTQQSSPSSYEVRSVRIEGLSEEEARGRRGVSDLGTLTPGSSIRVPFDLTFKQSGTRRFRIEVYGEDDSGDVVRLEYPVTVQVRDDHPAVSVGTDGTLTAGLPERVNVTVSNGFEREIRSIDVDVSSDAMRVRPISDGTPRIEAGTSEQFRFDVRGSQAGQFGYQVTVTYRTTTGLERTVTSGGALRFEPLEQDVSLDADVPEDGRLTVPVTVGNFGNAPLENVVVRGTATNGTVPPVAVGTVPAGTTRRVAVNVTGVESRADVSLTASYDIGDREGTATARSAVVAPPAVPGEIELTGLTVEREAGKLHITGTASNVGLERVDSVVVRVRDTDAVQGAPPNREYFVGSVPSSDFVSFDLYATAEGNVSEIPLSVTYLADGKRQTRAASVPYEPTSRSVDAESGGGGTPLVVYVVGAAVALLVVALIVVGWRNRDD